MYTNQRHSRGKSQAFKHQGAAFFKFLSDRCIAIFLLTVVNFFNTGLALAVDPIVGYSDPASNQIAVNIEGCNLPDDNGTYTPPSSFKCKMANVWPAPGQDDAYTPGNLGKEWEELDLVPHIFSTTNNGAAPETFQVIIGADNLVNPSTSPPAIGYDQIGLITFNATVSTGTAAQCQLSLVGGNQIGAYGIGGSLKQIVQVVEITQVPGTKCVWNYVQQLAVGASQISGSSNRSFVVAGGGAQSVPLPSDIQPQALSKVLAAVENSAYQWTIQKDADPVTLNFGNTCKTDTLLTKDIEVTIDFTKGAAYPTSLTATAQIQAINPSKRIVRYALTDVLKSSSTVIDTQPKDENVEPGMETITIDHPALTAGTRGLSDTATAKLQVESLLNPGTWIDVGTVSASYILPDSQIAKGTVVFDSVTVSDKEWLENTLGNGLAFSTVTPTGPSGTFGKDDSTSQTYVEGTSTIGPIHWVSNPQSGTGQIVFTKTVSVAARGYEYEGTLKDTASLPVGAGVTTSASASTALSTNPLAEMTVIKKIPALAANNLDPGEKIIVYFTVNGPSLIAKKFELTFNPGVTQQSILFDNLKQGSYSVVEDKALFFAVGDTTGVSANLQDATNNTKTVDLNTPKCSNSVTFNNVSSLDKPAKVAVKKITDPTTGLSDPETKWNFALKCTFEDGSTVSEVLTDVIANSSTDTFFNALITQDANCVVAETSTKDGWFLAGVNGDTTKTSYVFTVNLPQDDGKTFGATFKNIKKGKAKVVKTVTGNTPTGTQAYTFELRKGASQTASGTTLESRTADATNGGVINFTTQLVPGTYQLCEVVMPGWNTNLGTFGTLFVPGSMTTPTLPNPNVNNMTVCVNFSVGAGETKTFTVDNAPPPGGRGLTIGFWKNWASCASSKGGQKPVLDQTMAKGTPPGIQYGSYYLLGSVITPNVAPDCKNAVSLLNKSTFTGLKKASDPLFNMTAQLIAAELNLVAGAYSCPKVVLAVQQANTLLRKYGFNGNTYTPALTAADATLANNLATYLDNYNNNRTGVCP